MRTIVACSLAVLASTTPLTAQQAPRDTIRGPARTVRAAAAAGEIRLDGRLDEAAWAAAEPATSFTESYPNPGRPARDRTDVRVLYDADALYVGVRMYDSAPDSIAAQLARRDASGIFSDWVHVMLDTHHDRRSAYRFSVNPRGVQKDVYHFDDGNEDATWDAVWEVATHIDSVGWVAEYRIPLSQLRFSGRVPAGGRVWGLGIQRDVARRDERTTWSPWNRNDPGFVSRFGDLAGLDALRSAAHLELIPYASMRVDRTPRELSPAGGPFYDATGFAASAGADLKYGLASGLTLTATVNPDFGQVEADPAVVNLSAFESFFPEQRPFFTEGAEIFRFGSPNTFNSYGFIQPFYSRRIGRPPQRGLFGTIDGDEVLFTDVPEQTTIAAAAKLTGRTRGGWTVGVMDAVTAPERGDYLALHVDGADSTLVRRDAPVEPLSNYLAARLRRDLRGGQTVVGGMVTAAHRDLGADPAFDALLRSAAYMGGLDFDHSWANRTWNVNGFMAGSRIQGSRGVIRAAQNASSRYFARPDADHLALDSTRTSLGGIAGALTFAKFGGEHWVGSATAQTVSPGFEVNDVGFHTRADYHAFSTLLQYRENTATRRYRSYNAYVFTTHAWNYGGDPIFGSFNLGGNVQLANFWQFNLQGGFNPEYANDRLTRGGPLGRVPAQWNVDLQVNSDSRRRLVAGTELYYRNDASGEYDQLVALNFDVRPSAALRVRVSPQWLHEKDTDQFVRSLADPLAAATFGRRYVFADVEQTTVSMGTRVDWTFTPRLSLQVYAEPFSAKGDFRGYKEFLAPNAFDFAVYGHDAGTITRDATTGVYTVDPDGAGPASSFEVARGFGEGDFELRSLRGSAVLRWEYRPGSALFVVWQQERGGTSLTGDFAEADRGGSLFRDPARNVLVLKASWWFSR
jgi:hypothetical protein